MKERATNREALQEKVEKEPVIVVLQFEVIAIVVFFRCGESPILNENDKGKREGYTIQFVVNMKRKKTKRKDKEGKSKTWFA